MSPTTEDRLRAAFEAKAARVTPAALNPGQQPPNTDVPPSVASIWRARWVAPLLAAAAVAAVAVGTAAVVSTHNASTVQPGVSAPPSQQPPAPATPIPTATKSASQSSGTPAPQQSSTGAGSTCTFADFGCKAPSGYAFYQPLWPFPNYAAEQAWQDAHKSGGHQPWHLDADQTALLFAQNYLGYADITTVTSTVMDDQGAHIGVGYSLPDKKLHTAAVLHLVRYSPNVDDTTAGWEVVGSDDTDFSLEQPDYGSRVSSPMTVGGHVTGVDENIVVDVKDGSGSVLDGTPAGQPAGGQNSPWQMTVSFHGSGVLTIVAFTGGHLTQHERFAIQGVHT